MNERIEELVEQAGAKELGADLYGGEFIGAIRLDFLEKFAELIVAECQKLNSKELSITAIERLLPLYREHFGVEP